MLVHNGSIQTSNGGVEIIDTEDIKDEDAIRDKTIKEFDALYNNCRSRSGDDELKSKWENAATIIASNIRGYLTRKVARMRFAPIAAGAAPAVDDESVQESIAKIEGINFFDLTGVSEEEPSSDQDSFNLSSSTLDAPDSTQQLFRDDSTTLQNVLASTLTERECASLGSYMEETEEEDIDVEHSRQSGILDKLEVHLDKEDESVKIKGSAAEPELEMQHIKLQQGEDAHMSMDAEQKSADERERTKSERSLTGQRQKEEARRSAKANDMTNRVENERLAAETAKQLESSEKVEMNIARISVDNCATLIASIARGYLGRLKAGHMKHGIRFTHIAADDASSAMNDDKLDQRPSAQIGSIISLDLSGFSADSCSLSLQDNGGITTPHTSGSGKSPGSADIDMTNQVALELLQKSFMENMSETDQTLNRSVIISDVSEAALQQPYSPSCFFADNELSDDSFDLFDDDSLGNKADGINATSTGKEGYAARSYSSDGVLMKSNESTHFPNDATQSIDVETTKDRYASSSATDYNETDDDNVTFTGKHESKKWASLKQIGTHVNEPTRNETKSGEDSFLVDYMGNLNSLERAVNELRQEKDFLLGQNRIKEDKILEQSGQLSVLTNNMLELRGKQITSSSLSRYQLSTLKAKHKNLLSETLTAEANSKCLNKENADLKAQIVVLQVLEEEHETLMFQKLAAEAQNECLVKFGWFMAFLLSLALNI